MSFYIEFSSETFQCQINSIDHLQYFCCQESEVVSLSLLMMVQEKKTVNKKQVKPAKQQLCLMATLLVLQKKIDLAKIFLLPA